MDSKESAVTAIACTCNFFRMISAAAVKRNFYKTEF